jgi:hypothetical protein
VPSSSHRSTSGVEIPPNQTSFTGYAHLEQFYEFAKNQGRTKKFPDSLVFKIVLQKKAKN